jgi:homocitrate synthase NifV
MAHKTEVAEKHKILIRDSTLREGMDVPGVFFSQEQRLKIAGFLQRAKVPEMEIVAPGRVFQDAEFAARLKAEKVQAKTSGLVFASAPRFSNEVDALRRCLDRVDILMPVSKLRKPYDLKVKSRLLLEALDYSLSVFADAGVGFPHSTQASPEFLLEISRQGAEKGAQRIVIYDTNGSADPFLIHDMIQNLKAHLEVPVVFHAHNDLGMATANSLAAVLAGADGLDATVNGLGDRAGNASLEQIAMILHLRGLETGISLNVLKQLSEAVARESGIPVPAMAPVVGEFIATHKSPGHLEIPELFEAFDPSIVGMQRKIAR